MSWSEYLVNTLTPFPKTTSSSPKTRTVIAPLDEQEIGDEEDQNEEQDYTQDQNEEQDYTQDHNEEQDYTQDHNEEQDYPLSTNRTRNEAILNLGKTEARVNR